MNNLPPDLRARITRRHLALGWWGLLAFLTLGLVLETMHGFKVGSYLDPAFRMRRLMWTLAHAHGTLLALVNLAFVAVVTPLAWPEKRLKAASFFLADGLLLLPLGFFLGGIGSTEVDPSPGVLLVPVGAVCLLIGVALTAYTVTQRTPSS